MTNGFYDGSAEADPMWPCAITIADVAALGDDPAAPTGGQGVRPRRLRTVNERVARQIRSAPGGARVVRSEGCRGFLDLLSEGG